MSNAEIIYKRIAEVTEDLRPVNGDLSDIEIQDYRRMMDLITASTDLVVLIHLHAPSPDSPYYVLHIRLACKHSIYNSWALLNASGLTAVPVFNFFYKLTRVKKPQS